VVVSVDQIQAPKIPDGGAKQLIGPTIIPDLAAP